MAVTAKNRAIVLIAFCRAVRSIHVIMAEIYHTVLIS
jgi:hypothetical protein